MLHGAPGLINVVWMGPGQRGDDGALDLSGDGGYSLEVAGGTGGEARLDDVHVHPLKLSGDFHLFGAGHADSSRLLAIAEGGVQEKHFLVSHLFLYLKYSFLSLVVRDYLSPLTAASQKGTAGSRSPPHPARPGPAL